MPKRERSKIEYVMVAEEDMENIVVNDTVFPCYVNYIDVSPECIKMFPKQVCFQEL